MTFDWVNMLITTCCGAYIGNLLAKITIDRNELKLKRRLLSLEQSSSKPDSETETLVKMLNPQIKIRKEELHRILTKLALHHKWLYGNKDGVRAIKSLKDKYDNEETIKNGNYWINIYDYHFLLRYLKRDFFLEDKELFMSFGFNDSIHCILKDLELAIPQMKDPYGKIDEDNKFASKGDIKEALNGL